MERKEQRKHPNSQRDASFAADPANFIFTRNNTSKRSTAALTTQEKKTSLPMSNINKMYYITQRPARLLRALGCLSFIFISAYLVITSMFQIQIRTSTSSSLAINSSRQLLQPQHERDTSDRENATFLTFVDDEAYFDRVIAAIRSLEDRFNYRHHYDWLFVSFTPISPENQTIAQHMISGKTTFEVVSKEYRQVPPKVDRHIIDELSDKDRSMPILASMEDRIKSRFLAGLIYKTSPTLQQYDYYWKIHPFNIYHCDINFDPFKVMKQKKLTYGFTFAFRESDIFIKTLYKTARLFFEKNPQLVNLESAVDFISDDNGATFNLCQFWGEFSIGDLNFFRSEEYQNYFKYLDKSLGIFHEKWGVGVIETLAVSIMVPKSQIYHFTGMGTTVIPFMSCPLEYEERLERNCLCNPIWDYTWRHTSCVPHFYDTMGLERPRLWKSYYTEEVVQIASDRLPNFG